MLKSVRSAGFAALAFSFTFGLIAVLAEQPAAASSLTIVAPNDRDFLTQQVTARDLDLARAEDVRRLETRIRLASRRVCDVSTIGRTEPSEMTCRRSARERAAPQVARLVDRARGLAAAGLPSRIETSLSVIAPGGE